MNLSNRCFMRTKKHLIQYCSKQIFYQTCKEEKNNNLSRCCGRSTRDGTWLFKGRLEDSGDLSMLLCIGVSTGSPGKRVWRGQSIPLSHNWIVSSFQKGIHWDSLLFTWLRKNRLVKKRRITTLKLLICPRFVSTKNRTGTVDRIRRTE